MRRWRLLLIPMVAFLLTIFVLSISSGEEEFLKRGREGGIGFLSGGVGVREREILEERGRQYPLKLIFSNEKGASLSDVVVKVFDNVDKNILTTLSNGPWLFIDLPSGTYDLEASVGGDRKRISQVRVSEGEQKVISVQWYPEGGRKI